MLPARSENTHTRAVSAALALVPGPLLILADQLLKRWCDLNVGILSRKPILGQHFLVLSRVLNRGLAGDRFSNIPQGFIEVYTRYIPTAMWCALAAFAFSRIDAAGKLERVGLSLLLAAGASNLWDHWNSQFVTDSLQIYVGGGQYIPFNLADLGILLGDRKSTRLNSSHLKLSRMPSSA